MPPFSAFRSVQTLHGLDGADLHWGGPSTAVLNPPIQMLISSGNVLKAHPEIVFNPDTP